MCLGTGEFLRPQGDCPPGFSRIGGTQAPGNKPKFIARRLSCLKKRMPTGSKVFLALTVACGLWPFDWTHLKNGLLPHSCLGGTHP